MPVIDPDSLVREVKQNRLNDLVRNHLLNSETYIFNTHPGDETLFYNYFLNKLGIPRESLYIVGSAKFGYSCAPHKFGRAFNRDSDIDVAIISPEIYDAVWAIMLDWIYIKNKSIDRSDLEKIKELKNFLSKGFFMYDFKFPAVVRKRERKIVADIQLNIESALRGLSTIDGAREIHLHDVKARIYRSIEHVALYHINGFRLLQESKEI